MSLYVKDSLNSKKEVVMRKILILALWACLVANAAAGDLNKKAIRCMERIEHDVSSGDAITVYTIDGSILQGTGSAFMINSSKMYMWSTTDLGAPQRVMIPIADIDKVQYQKPSRGWKIVGFLAGAVSGWFVGAELAPEPEGWFDFSEIGFGCLGVMVGGVTGAIIGTEIDKSITVTVTLKCK